MNGVVGGLVSLTLGSPKTDPEISTQGAKICDVKPGKLVEKQRTETGEGRAKRKSVMKHVSPTGNLGVHEESDPPSHVPLGTREREPSQANPPQSLHEGVPGVPALGIPSLQQHVAK